MREPTAAAVGASPMAGLLKLRWVRVALYSAAIGAVLSFVGAFDSWSMPIVPRTAMFVGFALLGGALGFGTSAWVARQSWADTLWKRLAAVAVIMTLLMGVAIWASQALLYPARIGFDDLPLYLGISLVMSLAMTSLSFLVFRPTPITHAAPADAAPAPFLKRLPARLFGADLWAVSAEDHYLRVHTSRGEELILMRLADAIDELEGLEGAQTHRSWWVARAAIREVKRGDGRATILLPNGTEAPVSRTHARTLREAGWI